jgi:hypothetical protein
MAAGGVNISPAIIAQIETFFGTTPLEINGGVDHGQYDFARLNQLINRLDVEKDSRASAVSVPPTSQPYMGTVNTFFGGTTGVNYSQRLGIIKDAIFLNTRFGPLGEKIPWLTKPGQQYSNLPGVRYGYQDSGYNPREVQNDVSIILTPGSFIDPATRERTQNYYPSDNSRPLIDENAFALLGFPQPISFSSSINTAAGNCSVELNINGIQIQDTRNEKFVSTNGGADYFGGNPTKNQIISSTGIAPNEIKKYIISKELGDLLQGVYAMVHMIQSENRSQHCLFTTDEVLGARCRIMGLPSCVQDHGKKLTHNIHCVNYYPIIQDEAEKNRIFKGLHKETCLKNNSKIVNDINRAIINRELLLAGSAAIRINTQIMAYLQQILEKINIVSTYVTNAPVDDATESLDEFKRKMTACMAISIINEKGKVTQVTRRLFVADIQMISGLEAVDIITTNRAAGGTTFAEQILRLSRQRGGNTRKKGGARPKAHNSLRSKKSFMSLGLGFRLKNTLKNRNLLKNTLANRFEVPAKNIKTINTNTSPEYIKFIKRNCYKENTLLKEFFKSMDTRLDETETEDFLYNIYNYFYYISETPLYQPFLYYIQSYTTAEQPVPGLGIHILDLSLQQFKQLYIAYFAQEREREGLFNSGHQSLVAAEPDENIHNRDVAVEEYAGRLE